MNGAGAIAHALKLAGVDRIFSLSGNQIMPIYDACLDAEIAIVHVRHEAAAVYMADAHAQITGGIGVALLTAGPGFANGLSPLFSARLAESPVLLISGDAPLSGDGLGAFQEMDQTAVTAPLVKLALRPATPQALAGDLARCVRTALSGRKGPVHLALPFDLLNASQGAAPALTQEDFLPDRRDLEPGAAADIAGRILRAKRPLLLLGPQHTNSRSPDLSAALHHAFKAPVVAMESPRGLRDPALGAFSECLARCDLLVCLGKAIDFTLGFARTPVLAASAEIIVVDPEAELLGRAMRLVGDRVTTIQADARAAIEALTAAAGAGDATEEFTRWTAEVAEAIAYRVETAETSRRPHPRQVCDAVNRVLSKAEDPILICDGGEFGQWAQACCSAPTRIINGVGGAIGGGLCFALAAKLARPKATVVVLMGDGTAGFHFTEFDTAAREGAAFVAIIGNDFRWNAEHQIQLRDYGADRLIGCELSSEARYDKAAEAFACHGEYVTGAGDLDAALARALASGRPACVNVEIQSVAAPTVTRGETAPGAH